VILVGLAIDQIAQSGLSSLSVIYYSAQLFSYRYYFCYPFKSLARSQSTKAYRETFRKKKHKS
ncbi:hypothetical protein, partial [Citrobacter freundii]